MVKPIFFVNISSDAILNAIDITEQDVTYVKLKVLRNLLHITNGLFINRFYA